MRLKSMTIKNFKGIDEHGITIDFAPITMLFGPNNAGKSTILQAMLLAREVLCHNSADTNTVHGGGDSISLGSFADYVHKHEEWREVSLRFDMEIDELPDFRRNHFFDVVMHGSREEIEWYEQIQDFIYNTRSISIETIIQLGAFTKYNVFIDDKIFTTLHIDTKHNTISFYGCNPLSLLSNDEVNEMEELFSLGENDEIGYIEKNTYAIEYIFRKWPIFVAENMNFKEYIFDKYELKNIEPIYGIIYGLNRDLENSFEELPHTTEGPLSFDIFSTFSTELFRGKDTFDDVLEKPTLKSLMLQQFLSGLTLSPGKLLKDELEKILYIGPLREVPQRNLIPEKVENLEGWAEGYAAWDKIATGTDEEIEKMNSWLHGEDSLNIGYKIVRKKILEIEEQNPLISALGELLVNDFDDEKIPLLRKFIEESPRKTKWALVNVNNDVEVHPCDMGTGISQIMPIIVASALAKSGDIISMEQPELHIHPRWQVALGDLFIKVVNAHETPPLFLIESHSEHLLLRFLRRIRETSSKEIPSEDLNFYKENILVNYIFTKDNITTVKKLSITENGDFSERWPHGFFMEREEEIF